MHKSFPRYVWDMFVSVVYTEVLLSARSHCLPAALNNSSVSLNTFKQKLTAYKRDIVGKFAASLDVPTLKTLSFPRWPCSGLKTIVSFTGTASLPPFL